MAVSRRTLVRNAGAAAAGVIAAARGSSSLAQSVQSASRGDPVNATLLDLLTFIPLSLVEENFTEGAELATFGDAELRLSTVGVEIAGPDDPETDRELFRATQPIPYGRIAQGMLRADDPMALFGWSLGDVQQSLFTLAYAGGESIEILRGTFERASLEAAWSANGYEMVNVDGQSVASLSAEPTIDMESELGRIALSSANNATLLDEGTLVYCSSLAGLTSVLEAGNGESASLGTDAIVRSLVEAVPEALSGASVLPGGAFIAQLPITVGEEGGFEIGELPEPGPVPLMGLLGFVSGSELPDPDLTDSEEEPVVSGSTMVSTRHFLTPDEARIAAQRSLVTLETGTSFASGMPYAEMFAGWRVDLPAEDTVLVEVDLYGNESIWLQMIYSRDAGFLYS